MEESIQISPLPSKVLQSFINSESDETELQEVLSSSPETKTNINALLTLPRGIRPSSSFNSFQDAIAEVEPEVSKTHSSGICTLSRKPPIRRISTTDHMYKYTRKKLTHSQSEIMNGTPTAYSPKEPLTKNLPIKQPQSKDHLQPQDNYFTRTKSISATIGPLTKEVCTKLNISWENSDPCVSPQDTKVHIVMKYFSSYNCCSVYYSSITECRQLN